MENKIRMSCVHFEELAFNSTADNSRLTLGQFSALNVSLVSNGRKHQSPWCQWRDPAEVFAYDLKEVI